MKAVILALTNRMKSFSKGQPVPCWTDYLREQGGFRG